MHRHYTYLALGDSYTIGEAVSLQESFPYQTVQLLRKAGLDFCAPEIIARTGWTTEELQAAMAGHHFSDKYDFVSLLIGVNNQYRQQEIILFKQHFESLLKRCIELAGGKKEHLVVLSILTTVSHRLPARWIKKRSAKNWMNTTNWRWPFACSTKYRLLT
jgi:hypothetical protein